jgi:predicted nucleic acid-binding protein
MSKSKVIVINTGPIISLVAATGSLRILQKLFHQVYVPFEVKNEILKSATKKYAINEFHEADFLIQSPEPQNISPYLKNVLDLGEASVIQLAIDRGINTVCIDERAGRRVAKLNNLRLTGSIGILIMAKNHGYIQSMKEAIMKMKSRGIYLSDNVISFALEKTGEV